MEKDCLFGRYNFPVKFSLKKDVILLLKLNGTVYAENFEVSAFTKKCW
jgi:hypothetical protein